MRLKQYLVEAKPTSIGDFNKLIKSANKSIKTHKALLKRTPENQKGKRTGFKKNIEKSLKNIEKWEAKVTELRNSKGEKKKKLTHSQETARYKNSTAFRRF
jgi:hypothetical protein